MLENLDNVIGKPVDPGEICYSIPKSSAGVEVEKVKFSSVLSSVQKGKETNKATITVC
jgi:hypothetical protein